MWTNKNIGMDWGKGLASDPCLFVIFFIIFLSPVLSCLSIKTGKKLSACCCETTMNFYLLDMIYKIEVSIAVTERQLASKRAWRF